MKRPLNSSGVIPAVLLLVLLVVLVCGTVYAYMFQRTGEQPAQFDPAWVTCEVPETFTESNGSNSTVLNTSNVKAYLRVRLVTYWVNGEGQVAAKTSPELEIDPASGWVEGADNTFYYKTPVDPNISTSALLSTAITLKEEDGLKQVIDVFAEAIQAEPAKAVTESWGVTLNGTTITGMSTP